MLNQHIQTIIKFGGLVDVPPIELTYIGLATNTNITGVDGSRSHQILGAGITSNDTFIAMFYLMSSSGDDNIATSASSGLDSLNTAVTEQSTDTEHSVGIFYLSGVNKTDIEVIVSYTGSGVIGSAMYLYKVTNDPTLTLEETDTLTGNGTINFSTINPNAAAVIVGGDGALPAFSGSSISQDGSYNSASYGRSIAGSGQNVDSGSVGTTNTAVAASVVFRSGGGFLPEYAAGFSNTAPSPSYVGSTSATSTATLSLTGISGLSEGDLVVFYAVDGSSNRAVSSSGWTELVRGTVNRTGITMYYKVMGTTVDTSVVINGTMAVLTASAYRNVSYGSLSAAAEANSTTITPNSATVTDDDSIVLVLASMDRQAATITTAPTGYSTAVLNSVSGNSSGAVLYKTGVSSGTESPSSITWSTSERLTAYTMVLDPSLPAANAAGFQIP